MCVDFRSAVLLEIGFSVADFALEDLGQKAGHIRVYHGREELLVKCRMTEALFEPVTCRIRALRMYVGFTEFVFRWNVEAELRIEYPGTIDLETKNDEDRRYGRDPEEGHYAEAETDS